MKTQTFDSLTFRFELGEHTKAIGENKMTLPPATCLFLCPFIYLYRFIILYYITVGVIRLFSFHVAVRV